MKWSEDKIRYVKWSQVKSSEMKWSEMKSSQVKWSDKIKLSQMKQQIKSESGCEWDFEICDIQNWSLFC